MLFGAVVRDAGVKVLAGELDEPATGGTKTSRLRMSISTVGPGSGLLSVPTFDAADARYR